MLYTKVLIIISLLFLNKLLFGQESFELYYNSNENEFLYYTFQNSAGNYISLGGKQIEFGPEPVSPIILSISSSGEIINENIFVKEDTSYSYRYGFQKENGNYLLLGTLTDSVSPYDYDITYVCEMTPELNLVWEKMHPLPEPYNNHMLINYLFSPDSNLIIQGKADSSLYGYNDLLFTMMLDLNGNLLDFNFYEGWKDYGAYSEMIYNQDSTTINFFGVFVRPISSAVEWIEMDLDLNITDYLTEIDEEHPILDPVSIKKMPENRYIMGNLAIVEPGTYYDLYLKIMDSELNTLKDTLILYPERTSMAEYNGIGFIDTNNIWIPTFVDVTTNFPGTEVFRFHIFDSNLNLKGIKEYGGDKRYWFFNMMVTSDGGCLLTGMVPDYDGSWNHDAYVIKVMPEDILTFAEETTFDFDRDAIVFPNPFSTEINIQTMRKNVLFNLYDVMGNLILSKEIYQIPNFTLSTGNINSGFYFYTIQYNSRIIQNGKLIKK